MSLFAFALRWSKSFIFDIVIFALGYNVNLDLSLALFLSRSFTQVWRGTLARRRYRRMRAALIIIRAYRRYKVKSYIREVNRRFKNVRGMKDHGKHVKWPTPPKVLRKFEEALRNIYNRSVTEERKWTGSLVLCVTHGVVMYGFSCSALTSAVWRGTWSDLMLL